MNTFPPEILELMAGKFAMLADATRLAILRALMEGEKSVGAVVLATGRGQANVSKHLKLLADAGLIGRRKEGLQVFYRIVDPMIEKLCDLVCKTLMAELKEDADRQRGLFDELKKRIGR